MMDKYDWVDFFILVSLLVSLVFNVNEAEKWEREYREMEAKYEFAEKDIEWLKFQLEMKE